MNEQEFHTRHAKILSAIEKHRPTIRPPFSSRAQSVFRWLTGVIMFSPSMLLALWITLTNEKLVSVNLAAATDEVYLSILAIFLLEAALFGMVCFFVITLLSLQFDKNKDLGLTGPLIGAIDWTASQIAKRLGWGHPITPDDARSISSFVDAHPQKRDVIASWAAANNALEFTKREVDFIDRVAGQLSRLDAQWRESQEERSSRAEISRLLGKSGISSRITAISQAVQMNKATLAAPEAAPPVRF